LTISRFSARGAVGELARRGLQQEIVEPATVLEPCAEAAAATPQSHRAAEGVGDQGHPAQVRQTDGARPVVGMADLVAGLDARSPSARNGVTYGATSLESKLGRNPGRFRAVSRGLRQTKASGAALPALASQVGGFHRGRPNGVKRERLVHERRRGRRSARRAPRLAALQAAIATRARDCDRDPPQ